MSKKLYESIPVRGDVRDGIIDELEREGYIEPFERVKSLSLEIHSDEPTLVTQIVTVDE